MMVPGAPPPEPDTPKTPPWLLVAVNGFLILVALSALVSIWIDRTGGDWSCPAFCFDAALP